MMKLKKNHISVVMPVYNRTEYLEEAIGSVLSQTYDNYELIIVDDGSTNPKVRAILKKYTKHPKIKVFFNRHGGPGGAINFGAKKVKGAYLCRLDSDDLLTSDALEILNRYINRYPDVSYFYSARYVIDGKNNIMIFPEWIPEWMDEDGKCKSFKFDRERLLVEFHCNHLMCWKKKDFFSIGGMRPNLYWEDDYELALRMSDYFKFHNIDEALYMYRQCSPMRLTDSIDQKIKDEIIKKRQEEDKERGKKLKKDC